MNSSPDASLSCFLQKQVGSPGAINIAQKLLLLQHTSAHVCPPTSNRPFSPQWRKTVPTVIATLLSSSQPCTKAKHNGLMKEEMLITMPSGTRRRSGL